MEIDQLLKQIDIGEDQDCEFKSADGGFPKDACKAISAFANTEGGYIILGVSEKQNQLQITGVRNAQKMRKELWDSLNNTQKINRAIFDTPPAFMHGECQVRLNSSKAG